MPIVIDKATAEPSIPNPIPTSTHLIWETDGGGNIGVDSRTTSGLADGVRPNNLFLKNGMVVGNTFNLDAPYLLNGSGIAGLAVVGAADYTAAINGAGTGFNSVACGFFGWAKATNFNTCPAFVNLSVNGDNDVYFSLLNRTSARTDYVKFGGGGTVTMMKSSDADFLWNTDGGGDIGAAAANRPDSIYAKSLVETNNDGDPGSFIRSNGTDADIGFKVAGGSLTEVFWEISGSDPQAMQLYTYDGVDYTAIWDISLVDGSMSFGEFGNTTAIHSFNGASVAADASTMTMTNGPVAGNPSTFFKVNVNGTDVIIPCWTAP